MQKQKGMCVEINDVFYESISCASRQVKQDGRTVKKRCLSDKFPNYKIVPFWVTYTEKACTNCGITKPLSKFCLQSSTKDGYTCQCKSCDKIYHLDNKERLNKECREYYQKNKEEVRQYNQEHKKEKSEYNKGWYQKNKEREKRKALQRYYNNKEKINTQIRKRYKNDIAYRINKSMSRAIWMQLNGMKDGKNWLLLIDYTVKELMVHLENKFTEGMNWDNYGYGKDKWVIDHIIAKSKFNIMSRDCQEFRDCWALDNLQPLWWIRNMEKGDKPMGLKYLIRPFW